MRLLNEKEWHTRIAASEIAEEVIDIWLHCTVHPLSKTVADKIMSLMQQFNKLKKYPKRKMGKTYRSNLH